MDMTGEPKISVIIPVYNAERTMAECLGNLVHQTIFPEMELLLINDASTDGTARILNDCRQQFGERVRIFTQEKNRGPGAARNVGLKEAHGNYIGFVDADDLADPTMYEKLYAEAERTGADFTDCGFYQQRVDKAFLFTSREICESFPGGRARSVLIAEGGFTVTKLFRRDFLLENEIWFRPVYGLEDMDYLMLAILYADRVACVEETLYVYRDQEHSLVKKESHERNFYECAAALGAIYERLSPHERYGQIREAAEYSMYELYARAINRALHIAVEDEGEKGKTLKMLSDIREVRRLCISGALEKNPFADGISGESRRLIQENDKNPSNLLRIVLDSRKNKKNFQKTLV